MTAAGLHQALGQDSRPGRTVRLNGIEIHYEVRGTGEPLLLLHGFGGLRAGLAAVRRTSR